ncbi:unnamed protein product [Amoebophrya sp. A120]|nr:unnamed protein product [Amoebophrya sp. A120]|eukprot:GSA120T00013780001.1
MAPLHSSVRSVLCLYLLQLLETAIPVHTAAAGPTYFNIGDDEQGPPWRGISARCAATPSTSSAQELTCPSNNNIPILSTTGTSPSSLSPKTVCGSASSASSPRTATHARPRGGGRTRNGVSTNTGVVQHKRPRVLALVGGLATLSYILSGGKTSGSSYGGVNTGVGSSCHPACSSVFADASSSRDGGVAQLPRTSDDSETTAFLDLEKANRFKDEKLQQARKLFAKLKQDEQQLQQSETAIEVEKIAEKSIEELEKFAEKAEREITSEYQDNVKPFVKKEAKAAETFLRKAKQSASAFSTNFSSTWTCPDPVSIQDPKVKDTFDIEKLQGTYKELFLHDFTQYPACVKGPSCVQSVKYLDKENPFLLHDKFTLACFDKPYASDLKFELNTSTPGIFTGKWNAVTGGLRIPDTVVAFKEQEEDDENMNNEGEQDVGDKVKETSTVVLSRPKLQYKWVIELQCVDLKQVSSHIPSDYAFFVGINFYAKDDTPEIRAEMLAAAKERGIDAYMYGKPFGLYEVPHPDTCWYNKD